MGMTGPLARAARALVQWPRAHAACKRPVKTVASYGRFRENGREVGMTGGGWNSEGTLSGDKTR